MGACIIGCGKAVPGLEIANYELEKLVQTSDEWIQERTGIRSRRIAVNESTIDLACAAASQAMGIIPNLGDSVSIESTGKCDETIDPSSIDLVILTTVSPDLIVPCNAAALKKLLSLDNAIAFDINAACTGFIYGATIAESMMAASQSFTEGADGRNLVKRALIVSAERLTRITDWQDRNTCVLFGDGAGAVILEWKDDSPGIISTFLKNDDDDANTLTCMQSYSSAFPFREDGVVYDASAKAAYHEENHDPKNVSYGYINSLALSCDPASDRIRKLFEIEDKTAKGGPDQTIYMNGQKVFKFAARAMEAAVNEVIAKAGMTAEDIKLIVPHQANLRIIEFAAKRLGIALDKFQISIDHTGNTSSSCLPMALTEAIIEGKVQKGDLVVLVAFGGGLTSGAVLLEL